MISQESSPRYRNSSRSHSISNSQKSLKREATLSQFEKLKTQTPLETHEIETQIATEEDNLLIKSNSLNAVIHKSSINLKSPKITKKKKTKCSNYTLDRWYIFLSTGILSLTLLLYIYFSSQERSIHNREIHESHQILSLKIKTIDKNLEILTKSYNQNLGIIKAHNSQLQSNMQKIAMEFNHNSQDLQQINKNVLHLQTTVLSIEQSIALLKSN